MVGPLGASKARGGHCWPDMWGSGAREKREREKESVGQSEK